MRTRKALAAFTIYALSALIPVALNPYKVDAQAANCITGGTYLVTIFDNGYAVSRGVITLTQDGNFFAIYPNQSGDQGQYTAQVVNPYGDTQGAWRCAGTNQIAARALNFIYPGPASFSDGIGRTDYNATFYPQTRTVRGTFTVHFFPINANPLTTNGRSLGTFTFTGQRIAAPNR